MRGGFRSLVNPATKVSDVDLDATRVEREHLHEDIRMREYIVWLMDSSEPGSGIVRVEPLVNLPAEDDEMTATECVS